MNGERKEKTRKEEGDRKERGEMNRDEQVKNRACMVSSDVLHFCSI